MEPDVALVTMDRAAVTTPRVTFEAIVAEWLAGRKLTTRRAYKSDLGEFAKHTGAPTLEAAVAELARLPHGVANGVALTYRNALVDRELSPASVNRRVASLRSVMAHARKLGVVNWTLEVEGLKSEAYRDTRGPGLDAFQRLLAATAGGSARAIRNRALVRLMFDLALRRGEAVALDLADVDLDAATVDVLGKGRNEMQRLTLPPETVAALREWIEVRGPEPGALFRNVDRARKGKDGRLTGHSVLRILAELSAKAGIPRVKPHGLRHTAITEALELTNGNARAVQRFSRHRSIETVYRYDDARTDMSGQIARLLAARAAV